MKIPNRFPQFENAAILVVVASRREIEFYVIQDGVMALVERFYEIKPEYTDKEGMLKRRGRAFAASSGAAKERNDQERAFREFVPAARDRLKRMERAHRPQAIVVLAPRHAAAAILEREPREVRDRAILVAAVNYVKKHPLEILERIGATLKRIEASARRP